MEDTADPWDITERIVERLSAFALPLYRTAGSGRPEQIGSAFVVEAATRHFLVTAAHVLSNYGAADIYYYVAPNHIRSIDGFVLLNRVHDVAVVALSMIWPVPSPETGKQVVRLDQMSPRLLPRDRYSYAVIGFPETKNEVHAGQLYVEASCYTWIGEGVSHAGYAARARSEGDSILIQFKRKRAFHRDERVIFPKPDGMSGGPIFSLYETANSDLTPIRVVGVATNHLIAEKLIMGTDIAVPLKMIGEIIANQREDRNRYAGVDAISFARRGKLSS